MKKPIKHIFVPEHKKLSEKEKQLLLEKYHITIKELPMILKSDPAIQGLNAKEGDIIMIKRNSPTAGKSVYYRAVVSNE